MKFKLWLESVSDYHKELFDWLNNQADDIYVHFSRFPEVKINPRPSHHDPIGIFAFPKSYVLSDQFNKNHHFFSMPYITTMELNPNANILNLSKITYPQVEYMFKVLGITPPENKEDMAGKYLWETLDDIQRSKDYSQKNIGWNKFFNKFNFDAILDEGNSIIHNNEPSQIVFLNKNSYKILDTYSTHADKIFKKMAKRIIDYVASHIFGDNNYKLRYYSDSSYPTKKYLKADGKVQNRDYTISLNYSLQERLYGQVRQSLEQRFYGEIYLYSPMLKNSVHHKINIDFDRDNAVFKDIINKFNKEINTGEHLEDKTYYVKELMNNVLEVLKFGGKPKYDFLNSEFTKVYPDKRLNIRVGTTGRYSDHNGYALYINIKTKNSFNLSGNSVTSEEAVEKYSKKSAKELVIHALNHLEAEVYKYYNPDINSYRDNDYNKYENSRSGEQMIKWIEQLKLKAVT